MDFLVFGYLSNDGGAMISSKSLIVTSEFARKCLTFCQRFSIEPHALEFYFSQKIDCLKDKLQVSFVKERGAMKLDYEEHKKIQDDSYYM